MRTARCRPAAPLAVCAPRRPMRRGGRDWDLAWMSGCAHSTASRPVAKRSGSASFAGSGIGKSTLLAMLATSTPYAMSRCSPWSASVGREVREFLEDDLGAGRAGALGRGGSHSDLTAAAAPPGGLCGNDRGGALPRPGGNRCCC